MRFPVWLFLGTLAITTGCGKKNGVDPHLDQAYPDKLSAWRLFTATRPALKLNTGVVPYTLNTTLFSDYADKSRTVWMPPGKAARYRGEGVFEFPVGTIFTKTFSFRQKDGGERMIETRVLVRQASGWVGLPYIWNREQTDAVLDTAPLPVPVQWVDASGTMHRTDYSIPNVNQCAVCHEGGADGAVPLGPQARNLNRTFRYANGVENQLTHWTRAGYLTGAPAPDAAPRAAVWDDPSTGSVEQRARTYLDLNCASCHHPGARAARDGLLLRPTDAVDRAQAARIIERMESLDPEKMMPNLGHTVVDREAVQLVQQWLETLSGRS